MESDQTSRLSLLTPRERDCLALVWLGLRSKEMAPILSIDPGTVDTTLKRAGRRVGCSDRKALARLLHQHQPELIQLALQRLGQPQNALVFAIQPSPIRDAAVVDEPAPPGWRWPVPTTERRWNDLSAWQKRLWAAAIGLGGMALIVMLLLVAKLGLEVATFL